MTEQDPATPSDEDRAIDGGASHEPGGDPVAEPPDAQAFPPPPPGATPPPGALPPPVSGTAAPGAAPGWYPDPQGTRPDIVRYWDGSAWTDRWTRAEQTKAGFGEKFKRRWGWALLVVAALNAVTLFARLGQPPALDSSLNYTIGVAIGVLLGLVGAGAFWGVIAALFPGEKVPDAPGRPLLRNPLTWGIVVSVLVAPLITWSVVRPAQAPTVSISSPAEACQQFLSVNLDAASHKASVTGMKPYFQALADGSRTSDPAFSADAQTVADNPTKASLQTATASIITRCIAAGDLTRDQVLSWVAQMKTASGS